MKYAGMVLVCIGSYAVGLSTGYWIVKRAVELIHGYRQAKALHRYTNHLRDSGLL